MIIYVIPVLGLSVKCWVTLTFDSSPIKSPLQNQPSFPRRRESIVKMQLERLKI